jgi:hypothetical protein
VQRSPRAEKSAFLALAVIALLGFVQTVLRGAFESQGIIHTDVAIFMTVARGMLNGLHPYLDLFETKAPGIFVLTAASLKVFGDARLLSFFQAVVTVLFPFVLTWPVWHRTSDGRVALAAFAAGCVISLYAAEAGAHVFVEPLAAFFACTFLAAFAMRHGTLSLLEQIIVGISLFLAIGLKEPFVLSLASVLIFLAPDKQRLRSALLPSGIAVIAGFIGLAVLGILRAYFFEYLPHIFGYHLINTWGTVGEPLWLRTLDIRRIAVNLWDASPFLPFFMLTLWLGALVLPLRAATSAKAKRGIVIRWALATWLSTTAVGTGGDFYHHHFVFAVLGFAACMLVCAFHWQQWHDTRAKLIASIVAALLAVASLLTIPAWGGANATSTWRKEWLEPRLEAAAMLDRAMDDCGIDRYVNFIDRPDGVYGFTKHSPYGPIFQAYGRFIGVRMIYLEGYADALSVAPIMIMKEGEEQPTVDAETGNYLRESFTETPWNCVSDFSQPFPYHIWFRTPVNQ